MEVGPRRTRIAGIMAAGRGDRLSALSKSKPLTVIGGTTLLDQVFRQCLEAGIDQVTIVIRSDDRQLEDHIRNDKQFIGGIQIVHVAPKGGTGASLHALARNIGFNPCLISTADTIAPPGAYRRLVEYAGKLSPEPVGVVMATHYVRDESPIWIVSDGESHVRTMGKGIEASGIVFGNVRWLSAAGCHLIASMTVDHNQRDMLIMEALLQRADAVVKVYVEDPIFDIDDPSDVEAAACWLREHRWQ